VGINYQVYQLFKVNQRNGFSPDLQKNISSFIHNGLMMNMRKFTSIIIIFVYLSFGAYAAELYSQPAEIKDITSKRTEFLENTKDILESNGQDVTNLESDLNILKEELKTLKTTRDKLIEDKIE